MEFQGTTYVCIGKILKPQGIRGEFIVYLESDFPDWLQQRKHIFAWYGDTMARWTIKKARFQGKKLVYHVDALPDRNAVEAARDTKLYVSEDEARTANQDPDFFFNNDLIGLTVVDEATGTAYGDVVDIIEMPGQNLIEVVDPQQRKFLIPFAAALVPAIDLAARQMRVTLPQGLLPDEDDTDAAPEPQS